MVEFALMLFAISIGVAGFVLMLASFTIIAVRGGWRQGMASGVDGRWSTARILMLSGAALGIAFSVLILLFAHWPR